MCFGTATNKRRIDSCLQRNVPLWKINEDLSSSSKSNFEMYGDINVLDIKNIFNDSVHDSSSEWDVVLLAGGEERIDKRS